MMKKQKFSELIPKFDNCYIPFRSNLEIKIDQIHFRKKGQDEWSYFSKLFSYEDDYNHIVEINNEIDENLIIIYYKSLDPIKFSSEFVQLRVIINNEIYRCMCSIEWIKIEDDLLPKIVINSNLGFKKERITCLCLKLNDNCLKFLKQFNQLIETQNITDLTDIRGINIKNYDIAIVNIKFLDDINLYLRFLKNIGQIYISDDIGKLSENCLNINKHNSSYSFHYRISEFLKIKCLNIEKNDKVDFWEQNKDESERFWQKYLQKHTDIFSSALNYTMEFICDEGSVRGQDIYGKGEKRIDFLYKGNDNNAILIEIKGPKTQLIMNMEYREGIYPPTTDLSASVLQVMDYKKILIENYNEIKKRCDCDGLKTDIIKCYVIIGNLEDLKEEQEKSFSYFKEVVNPYVEIITFDDLFDKYKKSYLMVI